MTNRRANRGSSRRSMPASQGRSSAGAASMGGLASGRMVPARTSTVRVPAPVAQARSIAARTVTPQPSRARTSSGSRSAAITATTCESSRAANAPSAPVSSGWLPRAPAEEAPAGQPGATRRPQRMTMPGPCHSSSRRPMSREAARELSVGSAGSRRSPMTSTRRPSATREGAAVGVGLGGLRSHRSRVQVTSHSGSIVSPSAGATPPPIGRIAPPDGGGGAGKLDFRARNQVRA